MLTFRLYRDDNERRQVHVDPAAVFSIEESERRPAYGGYHKVAVLRMADGQNHVVEDPVRRVAGQLLEAKASQRLQEQNYPSAAAVKAAWDQWWSTWHRCGDVDALEQIEACEDPAVFETSCRELAPLHWQVLAEYLHEQGYEVSFSLG